MPDEMFFSTSTRSLRRGKRIAQRTQTCRPCLIWSKEAPDLSFRGVVMDITAYGMLIRMMDSLPPGTIIMVQLMRDEEFTEPLAKPLQAMVVRNQLQDDGFVDHGVQVDHVRITRKESRPIQMRRRPISRPRLRPRMHTMDLRPDRRRGTE